MPMPSPEWENASTDEKLEMLRDDIAKLLDFQNRISGDIASTRQTVLFNDSLLKEVAAAVQKLEKEFLKPTKKEK